MDNSLYHYGILGMKWGVRRSEAQLRRGRRGKTDNMSEDARVAKALRKKKNYELSNADLRKLNERTRLEQERSRLHPGAVKKGIAFVTAAAAITTTAINLYNNGDKIVKAGKAVGEKFIDVAGNMVMKDLAKHIGG